ncbi:MAG TPA: riboflavin synthase [Gammaproteobacteria bacterium]|jgi:riboflavin synthase|nr:riboflavin synthase [Gammaproteobacteria bacterium]
MFTGLIAAKGEVKDSLAKAGDIQLLIGAPGLTDKAIAIGDSVAINGVCLTVIEQMGDELRFDVSRESLSHTLIADWSKGTIVNLELALTPDTHLGGHFVSGHVDGVATLKKLDKDARSWRLVFEAPAEQVKYIARKGSVTLDGISLTVNSVEGRYFDVNIVPHTWQETNLENKKIGDKVHIEVDLIARYLERLLATSEAASFGEVTAELLSENGFL